MTNILSNIGKAIVAGVMIAALYLHAVAPQKKHKHIEKVHYKHHRLKVVFGG